MKIFMIVEHSHNSDDVYSLVATKEEAVKQAKEICLEYCDSEEDYLEQPDIVARNKDIHYWAYYLECEGDHVRVYV